LPALVFWAVAAALLTTAAQAGPAGTLPLPAPLPKNGSCPTYYHSSGDFCVPGNGARFGIARTGVCPTGYGSSGNYCLALGPNSRHAMPTTGHCPTGYSRSGDYCVAVK
jgi:hypothetical protein